MNLKPCFCGATPQRLVVSLGITFRWRRLAGDCCEEWIIEARVPTMNLPENYDEYEWLCAQWNAAPRGFTPQGTQ